MNGEMHVASQCNYWHMGSCCKRSPVLDYECWARSWSRFLGSQPADNISHTPGARLPLLSTRPVVTFPVKEITPLAGTRLCWFALVIWPVKIVPEMTYIVLSGTLSLHTTTTPRCIRYRDVVRPWASVHCPSLAHLHGTLCLQLSVT